MLFEYSEIGNGFLASLKYDQQRIVSKPKTHEKKIDKPTVGETVGEILELIRLNPRITREELSGKTGLSVRGIEWNLKKLKEMSIIKRIGPTKGGHWEIIDK
jgi:ATP-dependent DNA helicase RecG